MKVVKILANDDLEYVNTLLRGISFENGKKTATGITRQLKNNQEASLGGHAYSELSNYLKNKVIENEWIKKRYLPKKLNRGKINKFIAGDSYGKHFDASHMQEGLKTERNDFSFTLMLSRLQDYDGGELNIETDEVNHKVRLDAGDMVIYPSMYIHQVLPIVQGERIAYVGWIRSHIKDRFGYETLNAFEDMHISLLKNDLSDDDHLQLSYVKNRLRHIISD
jgi:PKHD-type hydroxylase